MKILPLEVITDQLHPSQYPLAKLQKRSNQLKSITQTAKKRKAC